MDTREWEERGALYARLEDLCLRADRGELCDTCFLSPRELYFARSYLSGKGIAYRAFGGYVEAERQRMYLLPDYLEGAGETKETDGASCLGWEQTLSEFGLESDVTVLRIVGSGYRVLTHRDFLGSLLGLGLERSVLGDLCVDAQGKEALVFCDTAIAPFIEWELTKVANDTVKVHRPASGEWTIPPRRWEEIRDTVASERLDCVVAALCGLSREKARETVCGGLVEVNFEGEERPDRAVAVPALISVRGFGRYRVRSLADRTKKGRLRLVAEKYL